MIVKCTVCKASFDASNFSVGTRIRCGHCRMILEITEDRRTGKLRTTEIEDKKGIPKTLGEFLIGRQLGKDGTGVVFEAYQPSKNRKVALKIFYESAMEDK